MGCFRVSSVVIASLALGVGGAVPRASGAEKPVLSLRAFAVNMSGPRPARAGTIEIVIERWSTDQEQQKLSDTLIEKGREALLSALQKIKPRAGYVRTSTSLGWDIHFAREQPLGDGRRVIIATDRPMSFWEIQNRTRSSDYEFTLAEIRLTKDGKGEGKLATTAKISWNKDTRMVEIENYDIEPVRLNEVRVEGAKGK